MYKTIFTMGLILMIGLSKAAFAGNDNGGGKMRLRIGFEHWYSDSFRTADVGLKDDSFSLGLNYPLPISWIEFCFRFEYAEIKADPARNDFSEFDGKHIYFATTGLALTKILDSGSQTVALSVMPLGLLWAKVGGHPDAVGQTTGFTVDWLFDERTGMYLDTRYKHYQLERLDGSKIGKQNDASIVVGVVTRL